MCIPIEIQGESLGYALVDQGASKSLIRQTALYKIKDKINIRKVENMSVLCSSGDSVPIIGCFATPVCSKGTYVTKTLMYIVANTPKKDVVCDVVIGRGSLSTSEYPCIDVRGRGSIYNPKNKGIKILCSPCTFSRDTGGRIQLHPILEKHDNNNNNNNITLNMIKVIVDDRAGLTDVEKVTLSTHLYDRRDNFMIPNTPHTHLAAVENNDIPNSMVLYNFMCDMDKCEKGDSAEGEIINTF